MSIKQLFIPEVLAEFSVIELFDLFYTYQIATIKEIYYIPIEVQGELYNDIYITIREWHHTTMADNFIQKLRNSYAGFIYDNFDDLSCKVYILNHSIPSIGHLLTNCDDNMYTNTSPIYLEKQLLINKLLNNKKCFDLNHEIKEYLFVDFIYSDARIKKNSLIFNLNQGLTRIKDEEFGYWALRYNYDIQLAATQCLTCGGFEFISGPLFQNVAPRALCCCPGFREYYLQEIAHWNEPLLIFD
jgi:hypothetical protein